MRSVMLQINEYDDDDCVEGNSTQGCRVALGPHNKQEAHILRTFVDPKSTL